MGEHTHRDPPDPVPVFSRSRLFTTGIAVTAGLALLVLGTRETPYPSLVDDRETTPIASESTRNTLRGTGRSSIPTPPPITAVETEVLSPATIEPATIANNVAHLLGSTPDPDTAHPGSGLDKAQDPALPMAESEQALRELLADPDTPVDRKIEAIDALGEGTAEAAGLLVELARNADDPVLRSTAIDALALLDEPGTALDALGGLVLSEPAAEVRADLYNALSLHAESANNVPVAPELVISTLSETAARPRLEGYRMVASMLHNQYQTGLADTFDSHMVTWLQDTAEHGGERYTRHLSVDALRLANTPGAHQALLNLSYSTDPAVSRLAEKALRLTAKAEGSYAH